MQDYYEILQVHPSAPPDAIAAAHTRLLALYNPEAVSGADEIVELVRQKRAAVEQAYAVLSDAQRRAQYDAERTHAPPPREQLYLDYKPLPPAQGHERDRHAAIRTVGVPTPRGRRASAATRPPWFVPSLVVGTITLAVMLTSLLLTNGVATAPPTTDAAAQTTPSAGPQPLIPLNEIVAEFDQRVAQARQVAEQQNTAEAWTQYGNALYDSVQVVREREPDGDLYRQRLPIWLQATQAYSLALALDPTNATVRSDLAATYCYYGGDTSDQGIVVQGVAQAQRAYATTPTDPRVLLNLGVCLVEQQPPATEQAIGYWRQLVEAQPEIPEARQAFLLIQQYQQPTSN
jgi:tetratricopeptide (TPR) repeat protein